MVEWRCECGVVLGQVQRNSREVRVLRVAPGAEVRVEGLITRVVCPACGRARGWMPGNEALRDLLGQCGAEVLARFEALEGVPGGPE
jgi:hypothetical protein